MSFRDVMKMLVQKEGVLIAIDLHRDETWLAITAKGTSIDQDIGVRRTVSKIEMSISFGRLSIGAC